jgi:hypothetical protein
MADQETERSERPEDDRLVRWLLAHVDVPVPDAAFVRRLRDLLVGGCPAT